jgi:RuvB-like protein 1
MLVQVEGIAIDEKSLAQMGQTAERTSMRHAVQLLTPASMLASSNGREGISMDDLNEVCSLFHDAKHSARLLAQHADQFIS